MSQFNMENITLYSQSKAEPEAGESSEVSSIAVPGYTMNLSLSDRINYLSLSLDSKSHYLWINVNLS